ncbi:VOC family protein [Candidatus Parcubacteria bacterium]|nr:VOC family protein [Candidatus Parcubacteria bacterium]
MNPVVHFEMPYEDKNRAAAFYEKAFGWKPQMLGAEMGEYVVMQTTEGDEKNMPLEKGRINGGMYKKPDDEMGKHPSFVIAVENVEAAMKRVNEAGGKVSGEPMDIPGVGKYVTFVDTEGNRLSILEANQQM